MGDPRTKAFRGCARRGALRTALLVAIWAAAPVGAAPVFDPAAVRALEALAGPASLRIRDQTGTLRFASFHGRAPHRYRITTTRDARLNAAEFVSANRGAFGLRDPAFELSEPVVHGDAYAGRHVRYRQRHRGVPVFGGRLDVHFDSRGELSSVSAMILPDLTLPATPTVAEPDARKRAIAEVRTARAATLDVTSLSASRAELMVFRSGLIEGVPGRDHLAWSIEVANGGPAGPTIRDLVFVDAERGEIIARYSRIAHAADREVSESFLANVVWVEGDPDPIPAAWSGGSAQQVTDWQDEIDGAIEIYNLFANLTGNLWLSYDGADAEMRTLNNDPGISCPNARWNGVSTNYCTGVTADDIVAHEWGHAYTEYTDGLIYAWQPGALNEAYSDIWGEVVDLLNARGSDLPDAPRTDGSCSIHGSGSPSSDDSRRWLLGEDSSAFGGAIRDLWHPNCYNDPGRVSDGLYRCSAADSGGVHANSGVPNHAFALLVDGGNYNGQTITGIGITKAAHIYWYAQSQLQSPTSDFSDHADALETACVALTGATLNELDTSSVKPTASGEVIGSGDCAQVAAAIEAVELRLPPSQCGFAPLFDAPAPDLCEGLGAVETIASFDFENGLAGWTPGSRAVVDPADFAAVGDWQLRASLPQGRVGQAAYGPDPVIGDCAGDDVSGVIYLESPAIVLPSSAAVPRVAFEHSLATEAGWDGGNLKLSVNGGAFALVPAARLEWNSYTANLQTTASGNTNPLAGEAGFTGTDAGSLTTTWGQTQINLAGLVGPGDTLRLRYELGLDGCNGVDGWYVDDVHIHSCAEEAAPECGDGTLELGEACDDANAADGDGCSSVCGVEPGWQCLPGFTPSFCLQNAAVLSITPTEIVGVAAEGDSVVRDVRLQNLGASTLHWHVSEGGVSGALAQPGSVASTRQVAPLGPIAISQSSSTSIQTGNSVACLEDVTNHHVENRYYRVFDLDDHGVAAPLNLTSVTLGIEQASSGSGSQPLTVNVHRLDGPFLIANLTRLGTNTILQPDGSGISVDIPVTAEIDAGGSLVVEIFTPDGLADQANFFIGSNSSGQSGGSYLQAPGCDIDEPTDLADIGFPSMHIVMTAHGTLASACDPLAEIPWASAGVSSGSLPTAASAVVPITFDATGVAAGAYAATICIDSNDPEQGLVSLPIQFLVGDDPDFDGVSTAAENSGPNGGDGNGDGLLDSGQPDVATIAIDGDFVTIANDGGCDATIDVAEVGFPLADDDYARVAGVLGFTLRNCDTTPARADVTIAYHGMPNPTTALLQNAVYRKLAPAGVPTSNPNGWFSFVNASVASLDPDGSGPQPPVLAATLVLADGQVGDDPISSIDGKIVDPGALALPLTFWNAAPIPSLGAPERGLIVGLLLLVAGRRVRVRRRRACDGGASADG